MRNFHGHRVASAIHATLLGVQATTGSTSSGNVAATISASSEKVLRRAAVGAAQCEDSRKRAILWRQWPTGMMTQLAAFAAPFSIGSYRFFDMNTDLLEEARLSAKSKPQR